jgi:hypothetical protein
MTLSWDGKQWAVVNVGNHTIALLGEDKNLVELPLLNFESLLREGRVARVFSERASQGYCGHCLGWLGASGEMLAEDIDSADPEGYRYWCSQQLGFLVEASPQIDFPFERGTICRALSNYVGILPSCNITALAQLCGDGE